MHATPNDVLADLLPIVREIVAGDVSGDSDLMAMGLDSLGSLELSVRAEDELGLTCSMDDVFDAHSVDDLAHLLYARTQS